MKTAIGYIRVSTGEQSNSIEMQRDKIEAYAKTNDLLLIDIIIDEDVSGSTKFEKRAGGSKVLQLLNSGKAIHIVSTTLDRMFRNSLDFLLITTDWDKKGIEFSFVNMGGQAINSSTPIGKMVLTMMAAVAELERNMISDRIKNILNHKKANLVVYGRTPYGFDAVDGKLVANEKEMHVVGVIKELSGRGKSPRYISGQLNEMEFPAKDGGRWAHTSVIGILKNNIYNVELEYSADEK